MKIASLEFCAKAFEQASLRNSIHSNNRRNFILHVNEAELNEN